MHRNGLAAAALVAAVRSGGLSGQGNDTSAISLAVGFGRLDGARGGRAIERERPSQALSEEREWLDTIARDTHQVAEGLRRLGADRASTSLLRAARPYMALTDARFDRVDRVIARLFEELGLRGEATLTAGRQEITLSVALDLSSLNDPGPEPESPVTALLEDMDRYRLVLTEGRFVSATGVAILDDGTAAMLQEIPSEILKARGVVNLKLVWRATPE